MTEARIVTLETLAAALMVTGHVGDSHRESMSRGIVPEEHHHDGCLFREPVAEQAAAILAALPPAPALDVERLLATLEARYTASNQPIFRGAISLAIGDVKDAIAREYAALAEGPITSPSGDELEHGAPDAP